MTETCLECGDRIHGDSERFCGELCGTKWLSGMLETPPSVAAKHLDSELYPQHSGDSVNDITTNRSNQGTPTAQAPKSRKCTRCGERFTASKQDLQNRQERHHIIPRAAGGPDHPLNLVDLCHDCHMKAHREMNRLPEEKPELLVELRDFVCTP